MDLARHSSAQKPIGEVLYSRQVLLSMFQEKADSLAIDITRTTHLGMMLLMFNIGSLGSGGKACHILFPSIKPLLKVLCTGGRRRATSILYWKFSGHLTIGDAGGFNLNK